jgi:DNA-binding PadR family transcriptional regulator
MGTNMQGISPEPVAEQVGGGQSGTGVLRSPVNWAVLGLVIEKPSYGYEIGQRFDRRFGEFLPVSISNIYAALDRLEKAALIESLQTEPTPTLRRQPRVHYRATGPGTHAYRGWLAERIRDDPQRSGLLGRLAVTGVQGREAMLEVIDRYAQECLQESTRMSLSDRAESAAGADSLAGLMGRLLAEEQRLSIGAQLQWIAYARREIEDYTGEHGGSAGESGD